MTADTGNEKALADIEKYGCHILHVLEDESGPCFTYSIGIEKTSAHPELIVTGLKRDIAHWIINEYNHRIMGGETFEPDKLYSGFLDNFEVMFRPVLKRYYEEYFGWGQWLYGSDEFRVFQLIFPNTNGKWPWDSEAPDEFIYFIPLLCEPFAKA
ncbi:MAG: DUF4262 domain-containing protein [Pseudomonadota bacterium]